MRISIIGAGHMGSAIAQELIGHEEVTVVRVCDAHTRSLQSLHNRLDSPKLRSFQVDARDERTMASILEDSNCVIGATDPALYPKLARIALTSGSHFCDLGSSAPVLEKEYHLSERAAEKSLWVVPNCGLDPGLSNMLCLHAIRQFDEPIRAHLRVGDVPLEPEPPFNFRISWSAEKLVDDYTLPVEYMEEGQKLSTSPLTGIEDISFSEPFSDMEAFHTAGLLKTICEVAGPSLKTIDHKSIRWPGHARNMQFLLALGFAEQKIIDVQSHLTYRDVLTRRLKQRLGGAYEDAVLVRISVFGHKDGQDAELVYEMIQQFDRERNMTAIRRCTSITAATIALQLASGAVPGGGVCPPEQIVPLRTFFDNVRAAGLPVETRWTEPR